MLILPIIHLRTPKTNSSYVYKIPHKSLSTDKVCTLLSLLPTATTQYVYDWRTNAHHIITDLVTFALLKNISNWWSVSIRIRNQTILIQWNLITAQTIANHSFSNVEYLQSLSFSFRLKNDTGSFNPLSWSNGIRTPPIPLSELSVLKIYKKIYVLNKLVRSPTIDERFRMNFL